MKEHENDMCWAIPSYEGIERYVLQDCPATNAIYLDPALQREFCEATAALYEALRNYAEVMDKIDDTQDAYYYGHPIKNAARRGQQ